MLAQANICEKKDIAQKGTVTLSGSPRFLWTEVAEIEKN